MSSDPSSSSSYSTQKKKSEKEREEISFKRSWLEKTSPFLRGEIRFLWLGLIISGLFFLYYSKWASDQRKFEREIRQMTIEEMKEEIIAPDDVSSPEPLPVVTPPTAPIVQEPVAAAPIAQVYGQEEPAPAAPAVAQTIPSASLAPVSPPPPLAPANPLLKQQATAPAGSFTIQLVSYAKASNQVKLESEEWMRRGEEIYLIESGPYVQLCIGTFPDKKAASIRFEQLTSEGILKRFPDAYVRPVIRQKKS